MSRMPAHVLYYFRYAFRASFFAVAITIISLYSPVAHADPHAVFYTDRAQEQVFFNTLAALNQADFVEPGIPGQPYSRDGLLKNRDSIPANPGQPPITVTPEQAEIISSTRTNLPAVVSRNITLEGDDVWTAYLVNQFALELAQRRSVSKLAVLLCQYSYGDPGCQNDPGTNDLEKNAFVTTPSTQNGSREIARGAILADGTQEEQNVHTTIQQKNKENIKKYPNLYTNIRPESPSLALLRKLIKDSGSKEAKNYLDALAGQIAGASFGADPTTFSNVEFKDGIPTLPDDIVASDYTHKLAQLKNLPSTLYTIGKLGEQEATDFQYYTQNPTAVADYVLKSDTADGSGALYGRITKPVSSKLAAIEARYDLDNLLATNGKYVNPISITNGPGVTTQNSLVDPNNTQLSQLSQSDSFLVDQKALLKEFYDTPLKTKVSPFTNALSSLDEPGIRDARNQATNGLASDFQAKTVTENNQNSFNTNMLSLINPSRVGDIQCDIFSTIPACEPNTLPS